MIATNHPIVIRHAGDAHTCALHNLALLDSREPLTGPALIGEVDGIPRAALDLSDGTVAADPFVPTAELVELLRLRAFTLVPADIPTRLRARVAALVRHPRAAGIRI
jgi:hypothetical protein